MSGNCYTLVLKFEGLSGNCYTLVLKFDDVGQLLHPSAQVWRLVG